MDNETANRALVGFLGVATGIGFMCLVNSFNDNAMDINEFCNQSNAVSGATCYGSEHATFAVDYANEPEFEADSEFMLESGRALRDISKAARDAMQKHNAGINHGGHYPRPR